MSGVIVEDTRQQAGKHNGKHNWWQAHGVQFLERDRALPFADYMCDGSNVAVDTKADVYELMGNLGAGFRRLDHECAKAAAAGYRIVFLCECGARYANTNELARVVAKACLRCAERKAKRCAPTSTASGCAARGARHKPFQGYQLIGRMKVLHDKYGAEFEFVNHKDSARRICELLGVTYEQDASGSTQAARDGV